MNYICPLVVEIEEGIAADAYAVLDADGLTFKGFFFFKEGTFERIDKPLKIKGFRTQEAKDTWEKRILPAIEFKNFDPSI